ncbi:TonB-dependent receptor [Brevundimonas sp. P7753]|jgi:outer membrane receptor protein involved in Fe transport|uniref:TonB-dependent receptor n=1 Tax=Brevundimonas sp. P7753 TaxID=2726982 RepID=UPI0015B7BA74|nr:TonB-dependent receptor [Brevundimonas sp. P7753]NWE53556.1 TonB-dependent receptor [Brevundimonas sp. P7753]
MSRLSLLSASALTACVAVIATSACAQEARDFNIPPGSLRDALNLFATQSDQQIFFTGDQVAGLSTSGLRGRYEPTAALDRLLAGTGLTWGQTRPGVLYVRRPQTTAVVAMTGDQTATVLDEVVVTGTLLRSSGELASPVVTLDRDALDRRGLGTVADTLRDLPQNYAGAANPIADLSGADTAGSNSVFATGVNLRGLGPDATLVLVNGRRLAGTGFRGEFADVSAIPSGAVQRVDVLLDGASALYGADAVAGVVNVILRQSFDGHESRLRVSAARGGGEDVMMSHLAGTSWDTGAVLLAAEYQTVNAFSSLDRPWTSDGDLRPFGGTDHRTVFSGPGNIVAYDPAAGGYVSQWAIRPGSAGIAVTPADFEAGAANLQSASMGQDLVPATERRSLYGRVRQQLGERLEISADLRLSQRDYAFAGATSPAIFAVSRTNPHFVSPDGSAAHVVSYSFLQDLGSPRRSGSSRSLGATLGGRLDLTPSWSIDAYLAHASERGSSGTTGRVNSRYLNEALGNLPDDPATSYSASRDGYFNPFGMGDANSAAVLAFIGSGFTRALDHSKTTSANILVSGTLFHAPAGAVEAAVGLQGRREEFETQVLSLGSTVEPVLTVTPAQDRGILAVFGEVRVPLLRGAEARRGFGRLDLSVAGRVERYDDFGTTTNPKLGVIWSPMPELSVRASWGTSFRAPGLPQLNDASAISATTLPGEGTSVLALYLYGGNSDLKPETAETFTFGVDYRSSGGLSLSGSLFDTSFTDRIAQPVAAHIPNALTDPALSPFVTIVDPSNNPADLVLVTCP